MSEQRQPPLPWLESAVTVWPESRQQRRASERRAQRRRRGANTRKRASISGPQAASAGSARGQLDGGLPDKEQVSIYRPRSGPDGAETVAGSEPGCATGCASGCCSREAEEDWTTEAGPSWELTTRDGFHGWHAKRDRSPSVAWCWGEDGCGFWEDEAEFERPDVDPSEPENTRWEKPKTRGGEPPRTPPPGYIQNCSNNPGRRQRWFANIYSMSNPTETLRIAYTCDNWRCVEGCSEQQRRILFSRLEQAFEGFEARDVVSMVITLDAPLHGLGDENGNPTAEQAELYRSMMDRGRRFMAGLRGLVSNICTRCDGIIGRKPPKKWRDQCGCGKAEGCNRCARGLCYCTICRACGEQPNKCNCEKCASCGDRKRKRQRCGRCFDALPARMVPLGPEWTNITEQHKDGSPHFNYAMAWPEWAEYLRVRIKRRIDRGMSAANARLIAGLDHDRDDVDEAFMALLARSGFGFSSTAEPARNLAAVLNYGASAAANADKIHREMHRIMMSARRDRAERKLRNLEHSSEPERVKEEQRSELERLIAEYTKAAQLPVNAPKGYRRTRSGRGFLPEIEKNAGYSGTVLRRAGFEDADGLEVVRPLSPASSKRKDLALMQAFLADFERRLAWEDAEDLFSDLREPGAPLQAERTEQRWQHDLETLVRLGVFDALEEVLSRRAAEAEGRALAAAARARQHRRPWAQRRLDQANRACEAIARAQQQLRATADERARFLPEELQRERAAAQELEALWFAERPAQPRPAPTANRRT